MNRTESERSKGPCRTYKMSKSPDSVAKAIALAELRQLRAIRH